MSRHDEKLITHDTETEEMEAGQTSNKEGLQSSSRKPSNTGPDEHQEHKAPVDGAFGNPETRDYDQRDTYIGHQVPADKARK